MSKLSLKHWKAKKALTTVSETETESVLPKPTGSGLQPLSLNEKKMDSVSKQLNESASESEEESDMESDERSPQEMDEEIEKLATQHEESMEGEGEGALVPDQDGQLDFEKDICWTSMAKPTRENYLRAWWKFLVHTGVKKNVEPVEADFKNYLGHLHTVEEKAPTTIASTYSKLNKVMEIAFDKRLREYPKLPMFVRQIHKGYRKKKAGIFEGEEIIHYLEVVLVRANAYELVRAFIVVVGYCGSLRPDEIRKLKFKDIQLTLEGYQVEFEPSKQRSVFIDKVFLVPKIEPYFGVMHEYLMRITKDLQLKPGSDLTALWTGKQLKKGKISTFSRSPLGKTQVYETPKFLAQRLGKENWRKYSGHSLRRTAGTKAADEGANILELQSMLGHKNPMTCAEYYDNSKLAQRNQAQRLCGGLSAAQNPSNSAGAVFTGTPKPTVQNDLAEAEGKQPTRASGQVEPAPSGVPKQPGVSKPAPGNNNTPHEVNREVTSSGSSTATAVPPTSSGSSGSSTAPAVPGTPLVVQPPTELSPAQAVLPQAQQPHVEYNHHLQTSQPADFMKFLTGATMTNCSLTINVNTSRH